MLKRTAETLAASKGPQHTVICVAIESKQAFVDAMGALAEEGREVAELHLVTHAGMYGPMFGTVAWPEQMSPHEWRSLHIPFSTDGAAYFHSCRSARWFAPFFARTFQRSAYGYFWYTTYSTQKEAFRWPHPLTPQHAPIYMFGCPGRKSHGLVGSARKYLGAAKPEVFKRFDPPSADVDASYDPVASLYNTAYADIQVRHDEWNWLSPRVPRNARMLDIGCGNGALLSAFAPVIGEGIGVDASAGMISYAERNNSKHSHMRFAKVDGPILPLEDASVDTVTSLLSFRYLDWDPLLREIRRVLVPGGRLLIVDMVAVPPTLRELPTVLLQKLQVHQRVRSNPRFRNSLSKMVRDTRWEEMVKYNPIRSEHEMRWYLNSRFPKGHIDVLNIGMHSRVLAFDSGPIDP